MKPWPWPWPRNVSPRPWPWPRNVSPRPWPRGLWSWPWPCDVGLDVVLDQGQIIFRELKLSQKTPVI
jgi:hypothetical protein